VSHGLPDLAPSTVEAPSVTGLLGIVTRAMHGLNRLVMALGGIALVAASLVLSYSVVIRYALKVPTEWQDETAIYLLVGATFLSCAAIQQRRGHIGIEALASILPPGIDRARRLVTDIASALFCAFFSWKSWTLFHEAFVDDQRSSSTWAPPLSIPYALMAAGMTLLTLQILLQVLAALSQPKDGR
jgi:TRAP-type C4-dicarboxylate transport system permease small subunit